MKLQPESKKELTRIPTDAFICCPKVKAALSGY